MLLFSRAAISVRRVDGIRTVRVEGEWKAHRIRIEHFVNELPADNLVVRHLFGRIRVRGLQNPALEQRLRNFLVNDCPLRSPESRP